MSNKLHNYTYNAEVFRTDIRATGVALTDGVGYIVAALCPQIIFGIFNLFSKNLQFGAVIFVIAFTGFITFVLLFFGPRTNHISS